MKNNIKSKSELYREYNKYVTSINKQLKALEKEIPDSIAITRYKGEFRRLKTTKGISRQDMIKQHAEARKLAESGRLDVENNWRAIDEAINTLNRWGYTSVNRDNARQVFDFLEDLRQRGLMAVGGSRQVLKEYKKAYKNNKITDENLRDILSKWL